MEDSIFELLERCTVKIRTRGGDGTGFFVAPGLIITCAHVVKETNGKLIKICWQNQGNFTEAMIEQLIEECDIALLRFNPAQEINLPCVALDNSVEPRDELYMFGYPDVDYPNGCPATFTCEGFTGDNPPLIKFKQGQVRPGMSGSPLLNIRTGRVCGVVKFTRDRSSDLGGGAIPTSVWLQKLPHIIPLQQQFHQQDKRWIERIPIKTAHNIPLSNTIKFVGRSDTIEILHSKLKQNDKVVIASIEGMGGVGKTELAIQYALSHLSSNTYTGGMCWLRARDEEIGGQILQFAENNFGLIPPTDKDLLDRVRFCWSRWPDGNVLIIVDDVKDYQAIEQYLPPQPSQFKVLITTRLKLDLLGSITLNVLDENSALELLSQLIGNEKVTKETEEAKELCKWLGYLPLALQLVGRYIKKRKISIAEMIRRLDKKKLIHPSLAIDEEDSTWTLNIKRGVAAAFELSWDELSDDAKELGCVLSLFALAPIPWEIVESISEHKDKEELEDARVELINFHLLQDVDDYYQLHQLIREFLRLKLESSNYCEYYIHSFSVVMVFLSRAITNFSYKTEYEQVIPLIPHIEEVATHWTSSLDDDELVWPFTGLGNFYRKFQIDYSRAEHWYKKGYTLTKQKLEKHTSIGDALNNLGVLYEKMGRHKEAELLTIEAISIWRDLVGNEHPLIATGLDNLAGVYWQQHRYTEAEILYDQALKLRRKLLGNNDVDLAFSLNNLATTYHYQKRFKEAEALFLEALELRKQNLGDQHPDVADTLSNIASTYAEQEIYVEAKSFYKKAIDVWCFSLGEKHPLVATGIENLAAVYYHLEQYSDAEGLCIKALQLRKETLGNTHPMVALSLKNLADVYKEQGRYNEAEKYYLEAIEIRKEFEGNEDYNFARVLTNLADLYIIQSQLKDAEPLYLKAIQLLKALSDKNSKFDENTNRLVEVYEKVADLFSLRHLQGEAEIYLLQALALFSNSLDELPYSKAKASLLNSIGLFYYKNKMYDETEKFYLEAMSIWKKALGEENEHVGLCFHNLAALYDKQGKLEEATEYCKKAQQIWRKTIGNSEPLYARSLNLLANIFKQQGKYEEAKTLYRQALTIREEKLGNDHSDTITTRESLKDVIHILNALNH